MADPRARSERGTLDSRGARRGAPPASSADKNVPAPRKARREAPPPPHELLELAQQVALDVDSTWAWSSWHALSIDAALRLFPKPGSNFGLVVLVNVSSNQARKIR